MWRFKIALEICRSVNMDECLFLICESVWNDRTIIMHISHKDNLLVNVFLLCYLTSPEQILIYNDDLPWPNPNPGDAGPIVCCPMGLPNTADYNTAWKRTSVCSDASSTEMQRLRLLRHSGASCIQMLGKHTSIYQSQRNHSFTHSLHSFEERVLKRFLTSWLHGSSSLTFWSPWIRLYKSSSDLMFTSA